MNRRKKGSGARKTLIPPLLMHLQRVMLAALSDGAIDAVINHMRWAPQRTENLDASGLLTSRS